MHKSCIITSCKKNFEITSYCSLFTKYETANKIPYIAFTFT